MSFDGEQSRRTARHLFAVAIAAAVVGISCHSRDPSGDRTDVPPPPPSAASGATLARLRAWPVPRSVRGVSVNSEPTSDALVALTQGAPLASAAERCPDHDECRRIANNTADVAHAHCDAQCDACCPHPNAQECARRACDGACSACADAACKHGACGADWNRSCRERCRSEINLCAGCRSVWCESGAALGACHADADAMHREALRACDNDCPAAEKRSDGSCRITCGKTKATSCSQSSANCHDGRSPDCRCECVGAAAGICVSWKDVCTCD
jgi:hypothetical protein